MLVQDAVLNLKSGVVLYTKDFVCKIDFTY